MRCLYIVLIGLLSHCAVALNIAPPPGFADKLSVLVVDSVTKQEIYNYKAQEPRLIASNTKLFTTLFGLQHLGPDFHWHTRLLYTGTITSGILNGNLYIKGGGDPTLDDKGLYQLFSTLKQLDIDKINGNIVLDDDLFTTLPTYSMLENHLYDEDTVLPNGLMINGNLVNFTFRIKNNEVMLDDNLSGYTVLDNLVINAKLTKCEDLLNHVKVSLIDRTVSLSGDISPSCDGQVFAINLLPPLEYNIMAIQHVLYDFNLHLGGQYTEGETPTDAMVLADYSSDNLEQVLIGMNWFSNNLIAETVLLSSVLNNAESTDILLAATKEFNQFLQRNHLNNPHFYLENGAGLSRSEFFTMQNVVDLLYGVNKSPLQALFAATLPSPGQEGTLEKVFLPYQGRLYAKSGSLNDVKAYSGYFYAKNGHKYIIAVSANHLTPKNKMQTKTVTDWVGSLLAKLDELHT